MQCDVNEVQLVINPSVIVSGCWRKNWMAPSCHDQDGVDAKRGCSLVVMVVQPSKRNALCPMVLVVSKKSYNYILMFWATCENKWESLARKSVRAPILVMDELSVRPFISTIPIGSLKGLHWLDNNVPTFAFLRYEQSVKKNERVTTLASLEIDDKINTYDQ